MNDNDGNICKVFIIDEGNASTMMASNERAEEFYPDSHVVSNFEGTQMEGGGNAHIPGLEFTLTEHPSGTNMPAQAPAAHETILNESPPGIDVPGQGPPGHDIALIERPPGMDALIYEPPAIEITSSEGPSGIDLFMARRGLIPHPVSR